MIDKLEALLAEATPGPWEFRSYDYPADSASAWQGGYARLRKASYGEDADVALAVAAANALPALLAAARAAMEYRAAQERCDLTGEWEQAREAAVVLDAALAALGEEKA